MVTPLYSPGLIKIDYEFLLGGKDWHIIAWLDGGPGSFYPYSTTDLNSIALQAQSAFSGVAAFTTTDTTFVGTSATDWGSNTGLTGTATAGGTGSEAPPTLPIQCAAVVNKHITRKYRGGHPKFFLSGIAEARVTANRLWTSGFVTGLEAAAVAWHTAMNSIFITHGSSTVIWELVNNSLFTGGVERPTPQIDVVTGTSVNGMVGSQRRRRGRI